MRTDVFNMKTGANETQAATVLVAAADKSRRQLSHADQQAQILRMGTHSTPKTSKALGDSLAC